MSEDIATGSTVRVRATATQWLSDEPWPGLVQVALVDAAGHTWTLVDKAPAFGADLDASSRYPVAVALECEVLAVAEDRAVVVSTARPHGIESTDGYTHFDIEHQRLEFVR